MIVYLCGGINGLSDADATDWREASKGLLAKLGHSTLDPMRRDYRGREAENVEQIIEGDLDDIDTCDALLVNAMRPSWGTAMEVFYAFSNRVKPVFVVHPANKPVSPWLEGHSTSISHSFPVAIEKIDHYFRNSH